MNRSRPKNNIREVRYRPLEIDWRLLFKTLFVFVTCGIIVNQCESNTSLRADNEVLMYDLIEKDSIIRVLTPKPVVEKKIDSLVVKPIPLKRIAKPIPVVNDTVIAPIILPDSL
jgi:hypothetical protein